MRATTILVLLGTAGSARAQDTTPPVITCPEDASLTADDGCNAVYAGPGATARDNLDESPTIAPELPITLSGAGAHVVTYTATDDAGNMSSCDQMVTVVDATPPVLSSVDATPLCLWPPNHKMVAFRLGENLNVNATDNCDAVPAVQFSGTSSEAEDGQGDGHTAPDFSAGDEGFCLRSERSGGGDGRQYSVEVQAVDASGNASSQMLEIDVGVVHDQRNHDCPALSGDSFVADDDPACAVAPSDGGVAEQAPATGCSMAPASGSAGTAALFLLGALLARRRGQRATGRPGTK
jgi:HYR domain-containing protein